MLDQAQNVRPGQEPDRDALLAYLKTNFDKQLEIKDIQQFPGGYSNLTYLLTTNRGEMVLRRPPFGRKIESAHDMGREFRLLTQLAGAGFQKIARPILFCDEISVLGAPFFLMQRVEGVILRNKPPKELNLQAADFQRLSRAALRELANLHKLDLAENGFQALQKPGSYIERQVLGWSQRYRDAQTDEVPELEKVMDWLLENKPPDIAHTLIHNDFKYDNLLLNPQNLGEIRAILDWEMATVGDPRMDVGTTLAYWTEANDPPLIQQFGCTHLPGNFTRQEVLDFYEAEMGKKLEHPVFFYVFGLLKLAVIAQQIYQRYKNGQAKDPRFAFLGEVVRVCARCATLALEKSRVSDLFPAKTIIRSDSTQKKHMENSSNSPQNWPNSRTAQLFSLENKVALITGASRGIGEAIARAFGEAGAKVVISSRKQAALDTLAEEFKTQGIDTLAIAAHAGSPEAMQDLVEKTVAHFGGLDIVVCNAAINPVFGPIEQTDGAAFDKIMAVNLKGPFELAKAAKPYLEKRGGGAILNISSIGGLSPEPWLGIYSVSKAALISLTKALAKEWAGVGIRANAICPGLIQTQFSEALWKDEAILKKVLRRQALQRVGTPEEIAALALYLCSDAAGFSTGAVFTADGGYTI